MDGDSRRKTLLKMLEESSQPISGGALARELGVSRQIIVQDIALLRAANRDIISTARGYLIYAGAGSSCTRCFCLDHRADQIEDELDIIVDLGGKVLDVFVEHAVYGVISADLLISNRAEAADFVEKCLSASAKPIMTLTDGLHYHTVEAADESVLDRIGEKLFEKGYLVP